MRSTLSLFLDDSKQSALHQQGLNWHTDLQKGTATVLKLCKMAEILGVSCAILS